MQRTIVFYFRVSGLMVHRMKVLSGKKAVYIMQCRIKENGYGPIHFKRFIEIESARQPFIIFGPA